MFRSPEPRVVRPSTTHDASSPRLIREILRVHQRRTRNNIPYSMTPDDNNETIVTSNRSPPTTVPPALPQAIPNILPNTEPTIILPPDVPPAIPTALPSTEPTIIPPICPTAKVPRKTKASKRKVNGVYINNPRNSATDILCTRLQLLLLHQARQDRQLIRKQTQQHDPIKKTNNSTNEVPIEAPQHYHDLITYNMPTPKSSSPTPLPTITQDNDDEPPQHSTTTQPRRSNHLAIFAPTQFATAANINLHTMCHLAGVSLTNTSI